VCVVWCDITIKSSSGEAARVLRPEGQLGGPQGQNPGPGTESLLPILQQRLPPRWVRSLEDQQLTLTGARLPLTRTLCYAIGDDQPQDFCPQRPSGRHAIAYCLKDNDLLFKVILRYDTIRCPHHRPDPQARPAWRDSVGTST
jgi:hypothetical protein